MIHKMFLFSPWEGIRKAKKKKIKENSDFTALRITWQRITIKKHLISDRMVNPKIMIEIETIRQL